MGGDDYAEHHRPWYASSLTTSRRIVVGALDALDSGASVIVAYPLRCTNFVYFRRTIGEAGYRVIVVTLRASREAILDPLRGRIFDVEERFRIGEMIEEGYADRPFSDLTVDTDAEDFSRTVAAITETTGAAPGRGMKKARARPDPRRQFQSPGPVWKRCAWGTRLFATGIS